MVDWLQKIRATHSETELVSLSREYLAAWYHGDLAQIAEECRPTRVHDVGDIHYWAERLAEGFCERAVLAESPDRHREMLTFFLEAARRAREITSRTHPAPASGAPRALDPSP